MLSVMNGIKQFPKFLSLYFLGDILHVKTLHARVKQAKKYGTTFSYLLVLSGNTGDLVPWHMLLVCLK